MENLFVYGTLLFPEVVKKITGIKYNLYPAELSGYRRLGIKGTFYPALVEAPGYTVKGALVTGVDQYAMKLISEYEGEEYMVKNVIVNSNGESFKAQVFVWSGNPDMLDVNDWDADEFGKNIGSFDFRE